MTSKQILGIAIRIVGLLVVLFAMLYFLSGTILVVDPKAHPNALPAWHYFVNGVFEVAVGLYLLRGAPGIIRFAYPDKDSMLRAKSDA